MAGLPVRREELNFVRADCRREAAEEEIHSWYCRQETIAPECSQGLHIQHPQIDCVVPGPLINFLPVDELALNPDNPPA